MAMRTIQEQKERVQIIHQELERLFPGDLATPLNYTTDFELVVAVILSAQCTDERVNIVTKDLFQKYKTLDSFARANALELERAIFSTGFYRNKAMAIINSAILIQEKHNGKVPGTMQELLQLPGVGRKTANVILGHLFKKVEGIAVDTHVIRLANKFGLTQSKNPDTIEKDLCEILPQEHWWNFSYRLKAYGRKYSPAWKKHDEDDPVSVALLAGSN
jgi:endonuclease III